MPFINRCGAIIGDSENFSEKTIYEGTCQFDYNYTAPWTINTGITIKEDAIFILTKKVWAGMVREMVYIPNLSEYGSPANGYYTIGLCDEGVTPPEYWDETITITSKIVTYSGTSITISSEAFNGANLDCNGDFTWYLIQ